MLQNWFILFPELLLISFLIAGYAVEFFASEKTSKTYYSLAQFFLLASLSTSIVFYNKSAFPDFWQNTSFTTLFKSLVYLLAWAWFYLSSKWFLNKNRPSLKFYSICFCLLLGYFILASSSSLITLAIAVTFICLMTYFLILRHWDIDKVKDKAAIFAGCSIIFCLILYAGIWLIYRQTGTFTYNNILSILSQKDTFSPDILAGALMILSCFMFLMAMVPFQYWFISFVSNGVLPVCGFLTLVPPLIYLCSFINLMGKCFFPLAWFITPITNAFAILTIIIGALSANRENNIRRLFGYLSIYSMSFSLIALQNYNTSSVIAAFAYMTISLLSLTGIYTVFISLKSKGDYLSTITSISGFYTMRPYMSAALLIFMFSLIGLAPTLGFLGYLSVINNLIIGERWWQIILLMLSLLFVAGACLQIVRIIYFEKPVTKFDRADKAIYICLFINVFIVLLSLANPTWLLYDALVILGGIS